MRILYFTQGYTIHDQRFLSALVKTPHQVYFLSLGGGENGLVQPALPEGIHPISWPGELKPIRVGHYRKITQHLQRLLAELKPDLVHAGPLHGPAYLVAMSGYRPLVAMSWGYDLLYEAHHSRAQQQRIEAALAHAEVFVGDCQTVRDQAARLGFTSEKAVLFPWGIDLTHFSPGEGNLRQELGWQDCFVVIANRAWEPMYGVETVAQAFVQAARQCPQLRLLLLSTGSQAKLIHRFLEQGGVASQVFFTGKISQDRLPDYYRSADIYLSASHSDGSSVSLMEALGCARPVLVSDIPGNREWITPGETGFLFPEGDAPAVAEHLLALSNQTGELQAIGWRARKLAEARADWNQNFPKLLEAYKLACTLPSGNKGLSTVSVEAPETVAPSGRTV